MHDIDTDYSVPARVSRVWLAMQFRLRFKRCAHHSAAMRSMKRSGLEALLVLQ